MESSSLYLTGYAGLIAVFVAACFQFAKYNLDRRRAQQHTMHERQTDAASLLTAQQSALNDERKENAQLRQRLDELDVIVDKLRDELDKERRDHARELEDLRADYEKQLGRLREQLLQAVDRLDGLQAQLGSPNNG